MRKVLMIALVLILFSAGAVRGQDNSLPPCSVTELENAVLMLADFNALVAQATTAKTISDLLEVGGAQIVWRDGVWLQLTYCAEVFELVLLMNQVLESAVSGSAFDHAEFRQAYNPYISRGSRSLDRIKALEAEISAAIKRGETATPTGDGLPSCTVDERRHLADNQRLDIVKAISYAYETDTQSKLLFLIDFQMEWSDNIWRMLPPCAEAYRIALLTYRYAADLAIAFILDLADVPRDKNPYHNLVLDGLDRLSDYVQWLDKQIADFSRLPSCSDQDIEPALYNTFLDRVEPIDFVVDTADDLSGIAKAILEQRDVLQTQLSFLPGCAEAFEIALLSMQANADAAAHIVLSAAGIGLPDSGGDYQSRVETASNRIKELGPALDPGEKTSDAAMEALGMPPCSKQELRTLTDDWNGFLDLVELGLDIETHEDLVAFIQQQFEWRDFLWSALPRCAEVFDIALIMILTNADFAAVSALDLAGVSTEANPFEAQLWKHREQIIQWENTVWSPMKTPVTETQPETELYYVRSTDHGAVLRSCPSYFCSIEAIVLPGQALAVTDATGLWYEVFLDIGLILYIPSHLMSSEAPSP